MYLYSLPRSTPLTERSSLLIHSLRLGYLRNVEDPYGPRLISFNPTFPTNPYITAASLADATKWPELGISPSPPLSSDDSDGDGDPTSAGTMRPRSISGFPGATGLKHTQTIFGPSRTGALGMSVSGRQRHVSKPSSSSSRRGSLASARDRERDAVGSGSTTATTGSSTTSTAKSTIMSKSPPPPQEQQQLQQHTSASNADPPPFKPAFVPKFKGAAEMDERRRLRLQARRGAAAAAAAAADAGSTGGGAPGIKVVALLEGGGTVDLMSSGEEGGEEEEELEEGLEEDMEEDSFSQVGDEDFDDVVDVGVSVDIDEDEFDPCVVHTLLYIHPYSLLLLLPSSSPGFIFRSRFGVPRTRAAQRVRYYAASEHDI